MRVRTLVLVFAAFVLGGVLLGHAASAQTTAAAGDPHRGYTTFVTDGCYECHGYQAQGTGKRLPCCASVGPMLAPKPIPYAAFIKQVRTPRGVMPSYSATILSDRDAGDIYAYLQSIPVAKAPSSIPLLESVNPSSSK